MTSVRFQPHSVLLDKGVIRRVYERRVRVALSAAPTPAQVEAANVYAQLCLPPRRLYITAQTAHILRRRPPLFAAPFLAETYPLEKGRYLRRWARRLRALMFAPEDAIVVAYGSFGIDLRGPSIGVEAIVTNDLKLAAHFHAHYGEIAHRFHEMIARLPPPYAALTLPAVVTTASILAQA
jgi:hypothetical protein